VQVDEISKTATNTELITEQIFVFGLVFLFLIVYLLLSNYIHIGSLDYGPRVGCGPP
jgi:hypothetical protein